MPSIIRERSPLAILADPAHDVPIAERDIRLEDYLNDKIQSAMDFDTLESLLANVETQKLQLEEQLQDAKVKLAQAKKTSDDHTTDVLSQTREFEEHQASIQQRIMIVTDSNTPDQAVERLKGPMEKMRKLELAHEYVELLRVIDALSQEAIDHLPNDPGSALRPYTRLQQLANALRSEQEAVEGAGSHLVSHVDKTVKALWSEMKKILCDDFEDHLRSSNWPGSKSDPPGELEKGWLSSFEKLLELQGPEIASAREPIILLPFAVMARPYVTQFRYHFMGDLETSDPQALGNHIFNWFPGAVHDKEEYLRDNVTPILSAHFWGSPLVSNTIYRDPVSAFITALLPVMQQKVHDIISKVSSEPQQMSKFVLQLLAFDEDVRTAFDYTAGNEEHGWKGLAWDILDSWFDVWFKHEHRFYSGKCEEIMTAPNSGQIDYDGTAPGKNKPTQGAVKVVDLLGSVTNQYREIRRFSYKVQFLLGCQLNILDRYHERLKESLDLYQTLTSTVGRTLHGITKDQQAAVEGLAGLETLCKVFVSADHVVMSLKDWSNDKFFVELWAELQKRAKTSNTDDSIAGPMTLSEVKDATSTTLGEEDGGGMFDECSGSYAELRSRAERLLVQAIKFAYTTDFRAYFTKPQWTTINSEPVSVESLSVTAELDQPLQVLERDLKFLQKTLSSSAFRRVARECMESLQDLLWADVLMRENFTTLGAAQIKRDFMALVNVVNTHCRSIRGTMLSMPKLTEALVLLNLPLEASETETITLSDAHSRCFRSATEAEKLLKSLGLAELGVTDARNILARRIEVSE
ncbi:rint-1 family protein [Phlyctema vagabunda]|uniref:Rint-1 family protein n=1 Tax=Phlyctema vagabunda TaxID=108571 RepID=A0ABR4PSK5_9HELO